MKLERFCYSDFGTYGTLILPDGTHLATVERPWLNNSARISCIPIGKYDCRPRRYNRGGYDAVEVRGVEGRTHILFHVGNYVRNSNGCILVNSHHSAIGGEWCGAGSKKAFKLFMDSVDKKPFKLEINNLTGGIL